jgi:hypothetical protein
MQLSEIRAFSNDVLKHKMQKSEPAMRQRKCIKGEI